MQSAKKRQNFSFYILPTVTVTDTILFLYYQREVLHKQWGFFLASGECLTQPPRFLKKKLVRSIHYPFKTRRLKLWFHQDCFMSSLWLLDTDTTQKL